MNLDFVELKKQSSDRDATLHPSSIVMTSNEFDARLNKLLSSHSKISSLTLEKIMEALRLVAKATTKSVGATAEEKVAIIKRK